MRTVPLRYNLRSLFRRRLASVLALVAIALSVTVLVVVLALARGFERALAGTGRTDNAIVLRRGAQTEGLSALSRDLARAILAMPQFARDADGQPLAEAELYAAFSIQKADGGATNIPIRGVTPRVLRIRDGVRLRGRMFRPGTTEVVVGSSLLERVKGCRLGGAIPLGGRDWEVVGVLEAGGTAFDSEIWGDVEVLVEVFDRGGFNSVVGRLRPGVSITAFAAAVEADPRLQAHALSEQEYFARQSEGLSAILRAIAWSLALVMSVGSVFGAANTLLASVAARTREIGTLLAIGFSPLAIFAGFLTEALALGLLGGLLGVLAAFPVHGIDTGTTNWQTFTEQTFSFQMGPEVILNAFLLAALIGVVGGALPAWRAARLRPVEALRSVG